MNREEMINFILKNDPQLDGVPKTMVEDYRRELESLSFETIMDLS